MSHRNHTSPPHSLVAAVCLALTVVASSASEHWAFKPLSQSEPQIDSSWPRNQIDHFVLEKLAASGLSPASDAAKRDLIRRTFFQLTGLPPSPEETQAILDDPAPDAFAKLVDRLLASPQFGQRWGRHWLDLARYADSNGLDENFLFREAWRFRNYVIDAINADTPLDRFILEQLAGDLLPYDSIAQRDRQRIGAGFLSLGPKVLLGNNPDRQRMEVADEQLDTIGKAFLGLTLGCARCHDHKFDPVPTRDYYAMAGIFTSTRIMEKRHMLGQQRVMEQLRGLGEGGAQVDDTYEAYWRGIGALKQRAKHAKEALDLLGDPQEEAFDKLVSEHPDAIAETANDRHQALENRLQAQVALVSELEHSIAHPPAIPPRAMAPQDSAKPVDETIRLAGEFDRQGERVPRGFLQILSRGEPAALPADQSGREQLAAWLTDTADGAGILTARVLANRIWHHLIGRGIVRSTDNFGRTGELPTHPELLDFLARELIDSGWSLKSLVRQIVLSRSFAMASSHDDHADATDPENTLLWRAHRRRLDPESLRDAMLSASGQLDLSPVDSTVSYLGDQATAVGQNTNRRKTDLSCRSVYLPVIRNDLPEIFEAFDFADPHATTGSRPRTTAATQALFLLNDESVLKAADALAARLLSSPGDLDDAGRIDRLFLLLFNAPPDEWERASILTFIKDRQTQLEAAGDADPKLHAWSAAAHAMFSTSRFQFLD